MRGEQRSTDGRPVAVAAMVDEPGAQACPDDAGMSDAVECRYCGRDFTAQEMALLRALIAGPWSSDRTPSPRCSRRRQRSKRSARSAFAPSCATPARASAGTSSSPRYHYLGYKTLVGAQMHYAVHDRNGWSLAMLGFSTAARKLAPRDRSIGWTPQLREKNLLLVIDNPRFLILPWIKMPNLGAHILAIIRRRLPEDWTERYNTTPVLIETFVETPRHTGAVYRPPARPTSEPHRDAGATTATSGTTSPGKTSGFGRYEKIGNASSTAKLDRSIPARPNLYRHSRTYGFSMPLPADAMPRQHIGVDHVLIAVFSSDFPESKSPRKLLRFQELRCSCGGLQPPRPTFYGRLNLVDSVNQRTTCR